MEYMGAGQYAEAIEQFVEVLKLEPTYSAAYFQAAIASRKNEQFNQARDYLIRGIEVADKKGDRHARDEMKQALEDLNDLHPE
jgi:Flp pilus assembly protein TadD